MCLSDLPIAVQERDEDATRLVTVLSSLLRIGRAVEVSLRRGHSDDAAAAGPLSAARTAFVHACSAAHQSAAGGISGQEAGQAELPGPAGVGPPGEAGHYSDARQEAQRAAEVHSASVDGDEDEEVMPTSDPGTAVGGAHCTLEPDPLRLGIEGKS